MNKSLKNIRINLLEHIYKAKLSYTGSCLTIIEILYVLYFNILKKTERFILSKRNTELALYCIFFEKKFISLKE